MTLRTTYRRSVAESRSPTGGIAAVSRAVPSSTRACTIGCFVLSCRSVGASRRSTICRFSSSLVGTVRPRSRPEPSRYETRAPSMKISSTSRRARRSVSGPRSVIERSTRSTITDGDDERELLTEARQALVLVDRAAAPRPAPRRGRRRAAAGAARSARGRRGGSRRTRRPSSRRTASGVRDRRPRATWAGATRDGDLRERGHAGGERAAGRRARRPTPRARRGGRRDEREARGRERAADLGR